MTMEKTTPTVAAAIKEEPKKKQGGKRTAKKHCPHGHKRQYYCKQCKGAGICKHNRQRPKCKECGGTTICEHGRQRPQCKDCRGSGICAHNRVRSQCKECGGTSICQHGRHRYMCKQCRGTSLCVHLLQKTRCKECKLQQTPAADSCSSPSVKSLSENESTNSNSTRVSPCPHGYYRTSLCKDCGVSSPVKRTKRKLSVASQCPASPITIEPVAKRLASARSSMIPVSTAMASMPSSPQHQVVQNTMVGASLQGPRLASPATTAYHSNVGSHGIVTPLPQRVPCTYNLNQATQPTGMSGCTTTTVLSPHNCSTHQQFSPSPTTYSLYPNAHTSSSFPTANVSTGYQGPSPVYPMHSTSTKLMVNNFGPQPSMSCAAGQFHRASFGHGNGVVTEPAFQQQQMPSQGVLSHSTMGMGFSSYPYMYPVSGSTQFTYSTPYHAAA